MAKRFLRKKLSNDRRCPRVWPGKRLIELHIDYEKQPEYRLEEMSTPASPGPSASKRCPSPKTRPASATTKPYPPASHPPPSNTASATAPRSMGGRPVPRLHDLRSGIRNDPTEKTTHLHPPSHQAGHHRLPRNSADHRRPPILRPRLKPRRRSP